MLNYALIGCGRIARNHIIAAMNNEMNIVAVCDVDEVKMDYLLDQTKVERKDIKKYVDYKEMILKEKIDVISIATESGKHASIALDCIDNNINLIIEKPIAMSINDANSIIKMAKEKGVKVSACHQNRYNLAIQELRKAVEENRFGKISHATINVRWNRNQSYYKQALWRGTWEQDGGALMNQCIHGIDLLRWMLGDDVIEVYGATRNQFHDYIEAEDLGVAILKFRNGALGIIEGTTNIYPENLEETLVVFGEKGTVRIGGTSANNIDLWTFDEERSEDKEKNGLKEQTSNVYGNGHTRLFSDMISSIKEDREPYVDAIAGRNALEIVLAIYKSQKEGVPVKLPLDDFSSLDMKGEF